MKQETLTNYLQLRSEVRNRAFEVFKKVYHELILATNCTNEYYERLEKVINETPDSVNCVITTVGITHQIFQLSYRWSWPKAPCGAEDIDLLEFEATTEFLWNEEKINEYIKDETEKIFARRAKWEGLINQMKGFGKDKE